MRKVDQAAEKHDYSIPTEISTPYHLGFEEGVAFANSKDNERILCAGFVAGNIIVYILHLKYVIIRDMDNLTKKDAHYHYHFLAFKTQSVRDAFLKKHEELIKQYFKL